MSKMEVYTQEGIEYDVRYERHRGVEHMVVPVVMMLEGVHHGSGGPLLHLEEELQTFVGAWNDSPVLIRHPEINGTPVSGKEQEVVDSLSVGAIYNTHFSEGKLKAEAWVDVNRVSKMYPEAYQMLLEGMSMDVSVGVYNRQEVGEGDWNGEHYTATARDYRPDHLALLPDQEGACNLNDGCGVRINAKKKDTVMDMKKEMLTQMKKIGVQFVDTNNKVLSPCEGMQRLNKIGMEVINTNEVGFIEIRATIQQKLDGRDNNGNYHYAIEIFESDFVYRVTNHSDGTNMFYRQAYAVDPSGNIEFTGEPIQVTREVQYNPVLSANKKEEPIINNIGKGDIMTKVSEKDVNLVIQSKHTVFTADDVEIVSTFSQALIDRYKVQIENGDKKEQTTNAVDVTKDNVKKIIAEQFATNEKALELLPEGIRAAVQNGLDIIEQDKQETIDYICANSKQFTAEQLEAKDITELKTLSGLIEEVIGDDYSLNTVAPVVTKNKKDAPMLVPTHIDRNNKK